MFFETANKLATGNHPQTEVNILLDAFALHTRNLFEFLYPSSKKNPFPTDIIVTDYLENFAVYGREKTKKKDLLFVWRKASKQVIHLTYTRNRYSARTKPWRFLDVAQKMHKTLAAFYESLPQEYKDWPYFQNLKQLLGI